MAAISISYSDSVGSQISGTHTVNIFGGWYTSCSSDNTSDKTSASSMISFPSLNGAKTSVINSITCTASRSLSTNATGGYSLALVFDDSSYSIGDDGKISSEAISHLNNYKSQNGEFPSIALQLDSWVSRPPANDDGSIATYGCTVTFSNIVIELTIQGGKLILRPNADVSVQHSILSGFTGVYQLINEEVADDAITCIGEIVEAGADREVYSNLTSVVSLMGGSFSKKNVVLMKPVSRYNITNPTYSGAGSVTCSVIVGNESVSFSDNTDTADVYVTNNTWSGIAPSSSILQLVNSYIKSNKALPEIQLSLQTNAHSSGSASKVGNPGGAYITQAYLEIFYEDILDIGVYHKVNDERKVAETAYQKQNGIWTEITEDECKSILSSSLCGR